MYSQRQPAASSATAGAWRGAIPPSRHDDMYVSDGYAASPEADHRADRGGRGARRGAEESGPSFAAGDDAAYQRQQQQQQQRDSQQQQGGYCGHPQQHQQHQSHQRQQPTGYHTNEVAYSSYPPPPLQHQKDSSGVEGVRDDGARRESAASAANAYASGGDNRRGGSAVVWPQAATDYEGDSRRFPSASTQSHGQQQRYQEEHQHHQQQRQYMNPEEDGMYAPSSGAPFYHQQHRPPAQPSPPPHYHQQQQQQQQYPAGASPLRHGPPYAPAFVGESSARAAGVSGGGFGGGGGYASNAMAGGADRRAHSIAVGGDTPIGGRSVERPSAAPAINTSSNKLRGTPPPPTSPSGTTNDAVTDAQLRAAEQARVRWAFAVDRTARVQQPLMAAIASSAIRSDLVDVVRLLSSATSGAQTTGEQSFVAATRGVNVRGGGGGGDGIGVGTGDDFDNDADDGGEYFEYDAEGNIVGRSTAADRQRNRAAGGSSSSSAHAQGADHLRSIGVQSGLGLSKRSTMTQVVEGDIASSAPTAQLDYDRAVAAQQARADAERGGLPAEAVPPGFVVRYEDVGYVGPEQLEQLRQQQLIGGGGGGMGGGELIEGPNGVLQRRIVAVNPSAYAPFSSLAPEDYPIYLAEARRLGVANRYSFVSLPRPPIELPPRRRVRAVQPTAYPHLHGRHDLALDETCASQLTRAYGLWVQGTGFVPKY